MLFVSGIALFVGGATMLGAVLGCFVKKENPKLNGAVLAFAAGLMTAAAVLELIAPALDSGAAADFYTALAGTFSGACFVASSAAASPLFRRFGGGRLLRGVPEAQTTQAKRALLFVLAIALHNIPEGFAAGVACGQQGRAEAFTVALGIALQNVPEGMVLLPPMRAAGLPGKRALVLALSTGAVEIAGTFFGRAMAASPLAVSWFLPAFAGGAMLYIVFAEALPESFSAGGARIAGFGSLAGFAAMLVTSRVI